MRHMRRLGEQSRGVGTRSRSRSRSRSKEVISRPRTAEADELLDECVNGFFGDIFVLHDTDMCYTDFSDFSECFVDYLDDYIESIYDDYTEMCEEFNSIV